MALGVRTLAMLWDAAWKAGKGKTDHGRIDPGILRAHYEDVDFVRSVTVNGIEHEISVPPTTSQPSPRKPQQPRAKSKRRTR